MSLKDNEFGTFILKFVGIKGRRWLRGKIDLEHKVVTLGK